ncbi:MAG: DUF4268 domain-containing protein [Novosphingobium sp.]
MSHPKLGTLVTISATEVWGHEAYGFTPWLSENLNLLSDALQIDELELQGIEISTGDFRLDILAEDSIGNPVVIENQFGATDHKHLGQLIAYIASRAKPTTTIWVAEKFKDDHRAAMDWLNASTTEDFSFFGVEIEALRIGESDPAPFFNVVSKPNSWTKSARSGSSVAVGQEPQRYAHRRAYWASFGEYLKANNAKFSIRTPSKDHWHSFSIGRSGFAIDATITPQKKRAGVELLIRRDPQKVGYKQLISQRLEIEAVTGQSLEWMELPGKHSTRIAAFLPEVDAFDEAQWPSIQSWMLDMMQKIHLAFSLRIKALDLTASESDIDDEDLTDQAVP